MQIARDLPIANADHMRIAGADAAERAPATHAAVARFRHLQTGGRGVMWRLRHGRRAMGNAHACLSDFLIHTPSRVTANQRDRPSAPEVAHTERIEYGLHRLHNNDGGGAPDLATWSMPFPLRHTSVNRCFDWTKWSRHVSW